MKKRQRNTNRVIMNKLVIFTCLFLIVLIMVRVIYLSLATEIDGINTKQMKNNRNTKKEITYANRGTIFDSAGEILAQNVASYTVIAYLDESRSKNSSVPKHVVDVANTANSLAPVLNMSVDDLTKLLTKDAYQVELGPGGRGINEIKKEEVENLNLPGIDFIQSYKRYYPNGDFASYILGYAKKLEDGNITGEMGLEHEFNSELSGRDGYLEYQKDLMGYKIPNTPEIKKDPENGNDIYLTIDSNIQLLLEQALIKVKEQESDLEWTTITVADAKTGAILATSSRPSFNPNTRNISSYLNPLVSYSFEPGSTMKIFTYMAALENGKYKGDETYESGKMKVGEDTVNDWNKTGWGTLTYDQGFALSSNTAIANIMEKFLTKTELENYFKKLGFGKKTGITLPNEITGQIKFTYPIEIANAGFGQGITTTPIQHIQALTTISNDGTLLRPYIIDKIIDSNTGEIIYKGSRKELDNVASSQTIAYIKNLMETVTHNDPSKCTGYMYNVEGYDVIGKTGTAQTVDETGNYSEKTTVKSVSLLFPKENPEIIIYAAYKNTSSNALYTSMQNLIEDIGKYLEINADKNNNIAFNEFKLNNYINKDKDKVISSLQEKGINPIVLGDGAKIIRQYPSYGITVTNYDKIFLLTNNYDKSLLDINGYSLKDVKAYCNLVDLNCKFNGNGFVTSYEEVDENGVKVLNINLESKK